ncbi:hypothetical protein BDL97_01G168600 [Sphagnum fallax]|nr:hypothetical protein BDL97_01G168600 [Sphagnum fallax]
MKFVTYLTACIASDQAVPVCREHHISAPPAYLINAILEQSSQFSHKPEQPPGSEMQVQLEAAAADMVRRCHYVAPCTQELQPDEDLPDTPTSCSTSARDLMYSLAVDSTTTKTVCAVICKCKEFIALGSQNTKSCLALLDCLETLLDILEKVEGTFDSDTASYRTTLADTLVFASKAFAFLEQLCHRGSVSNWWFPNKVDGLFRVLQCQVLDLQLQLNEEYAAEVQIAQPRLFLCTPAAAETLQKKSFDIFKLQATRVPIRSSNCAGVVVLGTRDSLLELRHSLCPRTTVRSFCTGRKEPLSH